MAENNQNQQNQQRQAQTAQVQAASNAANASTTANAGKQAGKVAGAPLQASTPASRIAARAPKTREVHLDRAYIHSGIVYGPGKVQVPLDAADDIEEKQHLLQSQGVKAAPASEVNERVPAQVTTLPGGQQNSVSADKETGDGPAAPPAH
jgi:hypothetical protein